MSSSTAPSQAPSLMRPVTQRIGDFEVIKTLGVGSFGKVKLAKHTITGHKVAMKFISKRKILSPEMSDRVEREIQYLGLLQHPHIIKLYDVTSTSESIVMVIEYLKGELFDFIVRTGRMGEDQARRFFQQIIAAVEYCHSNDIVHRDLKPENLLLDEQLNVKIADFGLSNVMKDGDFLKTSCGSPNYAAPEVISGKLYAGPEIDIWSCGVILYVMLCGRLPFDDDHIPMLFKKINGGIFKIPPYLSPGARHLLQRMLLVDSNKRITLAEIRETGWFQEGLPAYLATPAPRVSKATDLEDSKELSMQAVIDGNVHIKGLGKIDPDLVREVQARMPEVSEDAIVTALADTQDKRIRIAYELIADYNKAKLAAAQAAHERNASSSAALRQASTRRRSQQDDTAPARPTPSHICVLPGTIPAVELDSSVAKSMQARNPLQTGRELRQMTRPESLSRPSAKKSSRQRWHFGIRSRSPPLEVMLEIYRTLSSLGFEWKRKEVRAETESATTVDDDNSEAARDEAKKRRRREEEERIKQAQGLYFVEARCFMGGVYVYMDIQLYQVDDNENYLVDFRNVGYKPVPARTNHSPRVGGEQLVADTPVDGQIRTEPERVSISLPPSAAHDIRASVKLAGNSDGFADFMPRTTNTQQQESLRASGVSSPFLFLECACRLIVELAVGSNNAANNANAQS